MAIISLTCIKVKNDNNEGFVTEAQNLPIPIFHKSIKIIRFCTIYEVFRLHLVAFLGNSDPHFQDCLIDYLKYLLGARVTLVERVCGLILTLGDYPPCSIFKFLQSQFHLNYMYHWISDIKIIR